MILLRASTIVVSDLSESLQLYSEYFDYQLIERGVLSPALAESWASPRSAGRPFAVLQPASGEKIYIRLIEQPAIEAFRALRTFGWNAIELCVQDVNAAHERLKDSPFEIIGPPRKNSGLAGIHPMQVKGPDEEVIFLTEIKADVPPFKLPRAASLIDQIFILVIGCSDMEVAANWFADHLGLQDAQDMEIAYTMLAKAYGKDLSTQYKLRTMANDLWIFLEVDQYPDQATARPKHAGMLPPGCAIGTFFVEDFDRLEAKFIKPVHRDSSAIYGGKRAGTLLGPDGALVEIVEA